LHGLTTPAEYPDIEGHNYRYTPERRKHFVRLIKDIEAGKLKWVVVDAADRWGTADYWERVEYLAKLKRAGCQLWTVDNRHLTADDILTHIEGAIDQETSDAELFEKAWRVYQGKKERAEKGQWQGGRVIPYGIDVVCLGADGQEKFRVIGGEKNIRIKRYPDGRQELHKRMPAKDKDDGYYPATTILKDRLKILRLIFDLFATQATTFNKVTKRLNEMGVVYPNSSDGKWHHYHVINILKNPIYTGQVGWGKSIQAHKLAVVGNEQVPVEKKDIFKRRQRPKEHWTLVQMFKPIVPLDVWQAVQKKLEENPSQTRNPRDSDMFFAGLLYCGKCGKRMRAVKRPHHVEYCCSSYSTWKQDGTGNEGRCLRHNLNHEDVLAIVRHYLTTHTDKATILDEILNAPKERQEEASASMNTELGEKLQAAHQAFKGIESFVAQVGETIANRRSGVPVGDISVLPPHADELMSVYKDMFQGKQTDLQRQLTVQQKEYDQLTERLLRLPSNATRAIQQTQGKLQKMQAEIERLEGLLTDYAAKLDQVGTEIETHLKRITETLEVLGKEKVGLEAAEFLAEVIGRIVVQFEPTGKKYPTSRPVSYAILSPFGNVEGSFTDDVLTRASSLPGKGPPARRSSSRPPQPGA
jgi:hypothetical protein